MDAHVHKLVLEQSRQHALIRHEDCVLIVIPLLKLRSPPTAEVSVCMIGNNTKMVMLLPNIQNMNTVIRICDLLAVAKSNSFCIDLSLHFQAFPFFLIDQRKEQLRLDHTQRAFPVVNVFVLRGYYQKV